MKKMKLIMWMMIICIAIFIVVQLIRDASGYPLMSGETSLSYEFIDGFDLSQLEYQKVFDYMEATGECQTLHLDRRCSFSMPQEEFCWIYDVSLRPSEELYDKARFRMDWALDIFRGAPYDWITEEDVYFKSKFDCLFSCSVHISTNGGSIDAYVSGNSLAQCRQRVEDELRELYQILMKSNTFSE